MASNFRHNKKRNTGLAYEFLIRKLGSHMIEQDVPGTSKTLKIIKEYFSSGEPMAAERELFETIVSTRGVSVVVARKILAEVAEHAKKLDHRKLDIKKSNMIKEVHHTFGKDFFDSFRLPTYRLMASIQLYLDGCRGSGRLSETVQKIQLEEGIVQYMTSTVDISPNFKQDREVDGLVVKLATKKFEQKYGKEFTANQKDLLEVYSKAILTDDYDVVAKKLHDDKKTIAKILLESASLAEVKKDKIMAEKLDEATERLRELNVTRVNDDSVEEMLLYWKLSEELQSNE